eukprot:357569-Chlamydomonas_euryale.AAC.5
MSLPHATCGLRASSPADHGPGRLSSDSSSPTVASAAMASDTTVAAEPRSSELRATPRDSC